MIETDKEVIATAEMPGLEKQDIKLNVSEDRLEISAETKHEEKKKRRAMCTEKDAAGVIMGRFLCPRQSIPASQKLLTRTVFLK